MSRVSSALFCSVLFCLFLLVVTIVVGLDLDDVLSRATARCPPLLYLCFDAQDAPHPSARFRLPQASNRSSLPASGSSGSILQASVFHTPIALYPLIQTPS